MKEKTTLHGGLSLPLYWKRSRNQISKIRQWGTITRGSKDKVETEEEKAKRLKKNLNNYMRQSDRNMDILSQFLPDKPMADLSAFELLQALQQSRFVNGKEYSDRTMDGRLTLLRDIYGFAEDRGDALNDLQYMNNRHLTFYLAGGTMSSKERKEWFLELAKETRSEARSLTFVQQAALVRTILEHIEEDGRYLALAVMLYTGMRPSECRGLCWKDLDPFLDHPERHMLPLDRQRDDENNLIDHLKRPSSYRKVGVHFELEQIIQKRLAFTLKHASPSKNPFKKIASFPMCCYKNDFSRGCTKTQLAYLATKVLEGSIRVPEDVISTCVLDMFAYEDTPSSLEDDGEDLHVRTYLLRHDFWTWMQASTELSAVEKRYLFGHAIYEGRTDIRPSLNNEDKLWEMLLKLDHTIKFYPLHKPRLRGTLGPDSSLSVPNKGHYTLHLSPELLRTGGQVTIVAQANEYDDPIIMKTLTPTRTVFQQTPLQLQATLLPHTREEFYRKKSNTDYDNRMVRRLTRSEEDTNET